MCLMGRASYVSLVWIEMPASIYLKLGGQVYIRHVVDRRIHLSEEFVFVPVPV